LASLRHSCKFQRVSRLGSVTAWHSSSACQPNFAALNRGCHLYLAGRPSRWALAHISSLKVICNGFWATVYKTVRPTLSDCCPVLSVTLVYCGQTVGWIKIKLDMLLGLGPGHTVLDGDPAPPPPKGHSPTPIFGQYLLWPNSWMD